MGHSYRATVAWRREGAVFSDGRYSRFHHWRFDDGVVVPASSSPETVRPPLSRTDAVDPEEALVAAVSSCHMLFFLDYAARDGYLVDAYRDEAVGVMGKSAAGKTAMVRATLSPQVMFSGLKRPSADDVRRLHHLAHEVCYIANSVNFEVEIADIPPAFAS